MIGAVTLHDRLLAQFFISSRLDRDDVGLLLASPGANSLNSLFIATNDRVLVEVEHSRFVFFTIYVVIRRHIDCTVSLKCDYSKPIQSVDPALCHSVGI